MFAAGYSLQVVPPYVSRQGESLPSRTLPYGGALDWGGGGGSQYRLSILRNADVARLCRLFVPMSHVELKK